MGFQPVRENAPIRQRDDNRLKTIEIRVPDELDEEAFLPAGRETERQMRKS